MSVWKKLSCGHTVSNSMLDTEWKTGYCQTCKGRFDIVGDESTVEWTPGRVAGTMARYAPPKGRPEHRDDGGDPNPGFGRGE